MLFSLIKRIIVFCLLVLFRNTWHERFVKKLTKDCKQRRRLTKIPDVNEELDEVQTPTDGCTDDITFHCFNKDGNVFQARMYKTSQNQTVGLVALDLPGVGKYKSCFDFNSCTHSNLNLDMVEPMRGWNIKFRGMMTDVVSGSAADPVFVTAVLYRRCNMDPFDHWSSVPSWTLATHFEDVAFSRLLETISSGRYVFYGQWGDVCGRIAIEGQTDIDMVGWKGVRTRLFEEQSKKSRFDGLLSNHLYMDNDGTKLSTGALQDGSRVCRKFGVLAFPIGERWALDLSNMTITQDNERSLDVNTPFRATTCGMSFRISKEKSSIGTESNLNGEGSETVFTQYDVNGRRAYGVTYRRFGQVSITNKPESLPPFKTLSFDECIVDLKSGPFKQLDVGGKASNLSILLNHGFSVLQGVCIPTSVFKHYVYNNARLQKAIHEINACFMRREFGTLSDVCTNAAKVCQEMQIEEHMKNKLKEKLRLMFGEKFDKVPIAVRSSGISEDGESSSAAGQLETYLDIAGFDNLLQAIIKCWASNLSFSAVEYRRQLGQPAVVDMAVVVQEMVPSDTAGVLFTHNPLTGNPSEIIINASHGLGDTVVSGEVTPDTITVRRRSEDHSFEVKETTLDGKMPTLPLSEDGDVEKKIGNDKLCLEHVDIINLCRICIDIETLFGRSQDIEWARMNSKIYILQARPITSIEIETDEDMHHEFDTGLLGDNDCLTLEHIGEVLPGASSPLFYSVVLRASEICTSATEQVTTVTTRPRYANTQCLAFNNRIFINLSASLLRTNTLFGESKTTFEIFLAGRPLPEHTPSAIQALQGRRSSFLVRVQRTFKHYFIEMQRQSNRFQKFASEVNTFTVGQSSHTATALYDAIDDNIACLIGVLYTYNYMVTKASIWSGFIMMVLKGKKDDISLET